MPKYLYEKILFKKRKKYTFVKMLSIVGKVFMRFFYTKLLTRLIFLFLLVTVPFNLWADWYPKVLNYTRSNYSSGPQNWSISQSSNTWIYFGNSYGMLEFDGSDWTTYPVTNNTCVRSLLQYDNKIFAGAENEFGYFDISSSGSLAYHSLNNIAPNIHYGNVWKIHRIDNVLYFQGESVILKYVEGKIEVLDLKEKIEYSAVVKNVLWVATSHNVYYLMGDVFVKHDSPLLKGKQVVGILPYSQSQDLFVTAFDGLYLSKEKDIIPFKTNIDGMLSTLQVFCATINNKYIAIGTVQKGLLVIDYAGNIYTQLNVYSGLLNNTILSMAFDVDNNLWLGLDEGISYVALNFPVTNLYSTSNFYGKGTASYLKGDNMYLGTNQGLMLKKWPIEVGEKPVVLDRIPRLSGQVWDLTEIDGDLFCSHNTGIYIVEGNNVTPVHGTKGTWAVKPYFQKKDTVLAGTYSGFQLLKKEKGKWEVLYHIKGFEDPVANFECDEKYLWKSDAQRGIIRLRLNQRGDSIIENICYGMNKGLPSDKYNGIYYLDGKIVIATQRGIFKYDSVRDSMVIDDKMTSILGGVRPYTSLKQNKKSNTYWFVNNWAVGYSRLNPETNKYESDISTGQYFRRLLFGGFEHINPIDENCTLIGTDDGFSWMNPRSTSIKRKPYLNIRRLWLRSEIDSLIFRDNYKKTVVIPEISYQFNSLRFEFNTTTYDFNPNVLYSYKLSNYDQDWSQYSSLKTKEYTKLGEGKYTFCVRSINNYSQEPVYAEYSFVILPPWYRTNWAYLMYVIVWLILIFIMFKYFNYRWEKGKRHIVYEKDAQILRQEEEFRQQTMEQEQEILRLKQERLENELRLKSNELASTIMIVKDKNEIFSYINDELNKIHEEIKSIETKKNIRKLQLKINQSVERDDYWKKFEENFDLVHDNFFKNLKEDYPYLTNNERKLCAFLKMNLSSKEIAELTNISVRSVELNRYRLRKRLGMDRDDSLNEWLQKY